MQRIGLISDTHGLLRPEALAALRGCDALVHAGDIGPPELLERLKAIAPLTVVRGNNDRADWARALPHTALLPVENVLVCVVHDVKELSSPPPAGVRVVVSGHSHRPGCAERGGLLWVNPGSAGPRRFKLPVSVGELLIEGAAVEVRLHTLAV
ncbi:metallophosphoesterase family protein [Azohydromonas caseinilytica]|uniref:Phosphoesterase n=1 Tax=Azohydromonas caseinilytica TaxID=2728836 RepID=A0A848F373_9BURK|nr:metallophosphoesterase family protein [Azohydromonas caseinilytica]NML14104.1 metallophosphoesterase family protein [Azohydromonas caseinilytica]